VLGTSSEEDRCVLAEEDQMFWMGMTKTADEHFLVAGVESKETSEHYVIDLRGLVGGHQHLDRIPSSDNKDRGAVRCIRKRWQGLRYEVEHHGLYFYLLTNADGAKNNKLSRCLVAQYFDKEMAQDDNNYTTPEWIDVREYNPLEQIDTILPFENFLAILGRENGVPRLWIADILNSVVSPSWKLVQFPEAVYSLWSSNNYVFNCEKLRIGYSSFVTPKQVIDYNMRDGSIKIKYFLNTVSVKSLTIFIIFRKEQEVPNYDPSKYECRRIDALSCDGTTKIPMSLVFNKEKSGVLEGKVSPVLLYGYGSYGVCIDPSFDFKRTALLDRGVVYVIAHIRGGGIKVYLYLQ
jgi:oligopeptidase B